MVKKILSVSGQKQRGVGIIEVLVGIAIMGVLIGITLVAFSYGISVSGNVRRRLKAVHMASGNLDRAIQKLYQNYTWNGTLDNTFEGMNDDDFTPSITIEDITVLGKADGKKVISTVTWNDEDGDGIDDNSIIFTTSFYNIY